MLYLWMLWQSFVGRNFLRREEGQGLVEYALIIALVAVLLIVALVALKDQISSTFSNISSGLARTA